MNYRQDKYGNPLSILGFGCMRFPRKKGAIDMEETERELLSAIEQGVNYLDTAYIYKGSEAALGEILEKNQVRHKVNIATKLPHFMIHSLEELEKHFQEQLKRLRTDHIDFYLMHMLPDKTVWQRLLDLGISQWIDEKKRTGAIRNLGFSYHGNSYVFCELLDAYDWDFCQIQYNYLDEHTQAGRRGLQYAYSKGIPVIIMEPLRGGRLVNNLPEQAQKLFREHPSKRTAAQWAFSWLWDQKEVTVVLSGMNSDAMVQENIQTASDAQVGMFGEPEQALLRQVVAAIQSKIKVGCTGCAYCVPCPKGVNIPSIFAAYNRRYQDGWMAGFIDYVYATSMQNGVAPASKCIGCGKCERHCPQGISIREQLAAARKTFEGPLYAVVSKIAVLFIRK